MSETKLARWISNAIVGVSALLVATSLFFSFTQAPLTQQDEADPLWNVMILVGFAIYVAIGCLIVRRQPRNTIGWLLLAVPLLGSITVANGAYTDFALVRNPGSLPFGIAGAWIDRWILIPALGAFIPIFLLFPDGRLPSRSTIWRVIGVITFAAPIVTTLAFALTPGRLTGAMTHLEDLHVINPVGISGTKSAMDTITQIGGMVMLATAISAFAGLIIRYRRATPEVRQQIRWLALVGGAFLTVLAGGVLLSAVAPDWSDGAVGTVFFALMVTILVVGIPAACGIAILRYHLYDLNIVVRKTVVYTVLAGFVTIVYAGVVAGLSELVGGDSLVLSIVATGIVAALFQPVRRSATRLADLLVFGRRAEPYEVLSRFSERMGGTYAAEDMLPRMARVIAEGTGAERVELWLGVGEALHPVASWPGEVEAISNADRIVRVQHQEGALGEIRIRKPAAEPLTAAEDKLLDDLASQASVVVRNVGLTSDLQERVDELSLRADELRASRARIVAANDAERRRLERNIHDGAQQHLVALAVKLRLAKAVAAKGDAEQAARMLRELRDQTDLARETLLDLASGIYPATLEDRGIAAALEEQARAAGAPLEVDADGFERLSIETEAAVYFVCLEAMQNAQKYARASHVDVRLLRDDGHLSFEVRDDGVGFDRSASPGSGLQNMRDRLSALGGEVEIRSTPGEGTTVRGRVPLREGART